MRALHYIFKINLLILSLLQINSINSYASTNYHLIGLTNTFIPGSGQFILGDELRGASEFAFSASTFSAGYSLAGSGAFTLDGVPSKLPKFNRNRARARSSNETNLNEPLYGDILQEIGIKSHMTFTFLAYRDAAKREGVTEGIDQSSPKDLFLSPFNTEYLFDPWVYIPILIVGGATWYDYQQSLTYGLPDVRRLTPYSNFLYSLNYQVVQPVGSGAPEEMFYRGYFQNEMLYLTKSPIAAIALSTAAFAFSHGPGPGRITAGVAGAYLGYLSHKYNGNLKPGIAVHFWSNLFLGISTVFLSHEAQQTTPPTALSVQINY